MLNIMLQVKTLLCWTLRQPRGDSGQKSFHYIEMICGLFATGTARVFRCTRPST